MSRSLNRATTIAVRFTAFAVCFFSVIQTSGDVAVYFGASGTVALIVGTGVSWLCFVVLWLRPKPSFVA